MSYESEVQRMQTISANLMEQIDNMLSTVYTKDELITIVENYFPEGNIALSQNVDLYTVLNDMKKLQFNGLLSEEVCDEKFDKVRMAIIDYETDGKFNFS